MSTSRLASAQLPRRRPHPRWYTALSTWLFEIQIWLISTVPISSAVTSGSTSGQLEQRGAAVRQGRSRSPLVPQGSMRLIAVSGNTRSGSRGVRMLVGDLHVDADEVGGGRAVPRKSRGLVTAPVLAGPRAVELRAGLGVLGTLAPEAVGGVLAARRVARLERTALRRGAT